VAQLRQIEADEQVLQGGMHGVQVLLFELGKKLLGQVSKQVP
jgi:hypothetical protein